MMSIKNTVILSIHGIDYHCIIIVIGKCEPINLSKNVSLAVKRGTLFVIKRKFHRYTNLLCLDDIATNSIVISNKVSFSEKNLSTLWVK